jgi:hypothetical protein
MQVQAKIPAKMKCFFIDFCNVSNFRLLITFCFFLSDQMRRLVLFLTLQKYGGIVSEGLQNDDASVKMSVAGELLHFC